MATSVNVCNERADNAINAMMATVVGTALVPAHVNWALTASAWGLYKTNDLGEGMGDGSGTL